MIDNGNMIPFIDLPSMFNEISNENETDILNCLRTCQFTGNHYVDRFERTLGNFLCVNHVIGVSSGTDAVMLACEVLNINEGDYVLMPANTSIELAFGVSRSGARPLFVDVDPDTYLFDAERAEKVLSTHYKKKRVKAILFSDLYGQQPNMEQFQDLAKKYKLYLIEDASHAVGSTHKNKHIGYYSDITIISCQPEFILPSIGQAGAIITNDTMLAKKLRIIINQGSDKEYSHIYIGGSYKLDNLVAAQLYHSVIKLEDWNRRRKRIAKVYNDNFTSDRRPTQQPNSRHVYNFYEYKCSSGLERDKVEKVLMQNRIGYGFHYPILISDTPMYADLGILETPVAYELRDVLISLPVHPHMSEDQALEVVLAVQSVSD